MRAGACEHEPRLNRTITRDAKSQGGCFALAATRVLTLLRCTFMLGAYSLAGCRNKDGEFQMAVLVNTSRTVNPDMNDTEKAHYTVGIWPFHRSQTIADIEAYADIIIGVTGGIVTVVKAVSKVVPSAADSNRWEVIADDDAALDERAVGLLGQRLSPEFAWKPGQGWPVKLVDTGEIVEAHRAGPPEVALGGYRLLVDADGTAHLYAPRGGDVHIHAGS